MSSRAQSLPTDVFSCKECTYAFTSEIFLHKHIKRSHNGIYCQMLRDGQIADPSFPQATNSAAASSQKREDPGQVKSYNPNQTARTVAALPDVKKNTYTKKKALICKKCDTSFSRPDELDSHECQTYSPSPPYVLSGDTDGPDDEPQTLELPLLDSSMAIRMAQTMDALKSQSDTQVCDSEKTYLLACQIFHENMKRSLENICSIMQNPGQIPSESCRKFVSAVSGGDQDEAREEPRPPRAPQQNVEPRSGGEVKSSPRETHVCKRCNKAFSHSSALKKHERIRHGGERPYPDKRPRERGESFDQSTGRMSRQQRAAAGGGRPFKCEQCGDSFGLLGALQAHQLTHRGEKRYHQGTLKKHRLVT